MKLTQKDERYARRLIQLADAQRHKSRKLSRTCSFGNKTSRKNVNAIKKKKKRITRCTVDKLVEVKNVCHKCVRVVMLQEMKIEDDDKIED
jgi:hypothetical protein